VDRHFANLLLRKGAAAELGHVFAKLSQTLGQQNSCLPIIDESLLAALSEANCVTEFTSEEARAQHDISTPLVLVRANQSEGYLYTNRFFQYEVRIANAIVSRNQPVANGAARAKALQGFLTDADDPLQVTAATQAVLRQLTIITGGPGTGKTSTVVKILAGLLKAEGDLQIRLAAPTGKAAMRLSESILVAAKRLNLNVPAEVSTLHRLLGVRGDGRSYRYHPNNPLPVDVLILDEASMIDIVMFDRLLAALPQATRLIMLGDPFQLPSVESGCVLGDLTAQGTCYSAGFRQQIAELKEQQLTNIDLAGEPSEHPLADSHCALKTSYRFKDDAGIGRLASLLRSATLPPDETEDFAHDDAVIIRRQFSPDTVLEAMTELYEQYLKACHEHADAPRLLELFEQARLLTPVKEGDFGVHQLNQRFTVKNFPDAEPYYHGKPVMIEQNHYALRLFNGDVGICVRRGQRIEVAFRSLDGGIEYFLPSRLPQHDTCFAMTVHKSQGSEFDQVCLVLPDTSQEEFISRELVYTGVTRCRQHLTLFTTQALTSSRPHERISGLKRQFELAPNSAARSNGASTNDGKDENSNGQLGLF
jgi:exodeoxyribonuclease V alpha subunit